MLKILQAREFQKNIYSCFIDYAKAFDCVDHKKLENSEREGNTRPAFWEIFMQVRKQQLELDMEQQKEKGMTEDEMVGGHHRLDGHEFE